MPTIGEVVSRVKNTLKVVHEDAFITDRYVYSVIKKHCESLLLKYNTLNIITNPELYSQLYVELEESQDLPDEVKNMADILIHGKLKKSVIKIPEIRSYMGKLLIQSVYSVDYFTQYQQLTLKELANFKNSFYRKFIKPLFYYIKDEYLYVLDDVEKVMISAAFKDDVSVYSSNETGKQPCIRMQDSKFSYPENILTEAENFAVQEITMKYNIQTLPEKDDKQYNTRP